MTKLTKNSKDGNKDILAEKLQDKNFMKKLMNKILKDDAELFKELAKH